MGPCIASFFFFSVALRPNAGHSLLILEVSRSHTTSHHSRQDSSGRVVSSSQRPVSDNTQHSQQTNVHALRWDSNPRSQQASGRRPTPQTARPLGPAHLKNILIQHAMSHSLFYLETALHVSGGTTIHHQERKLPYLQHLVFVTLLLVPAAIAAGSRSRSRSRMKLQFHPDSARQLSANVYVIYHCCMYSEKLLMMDRGTVRNMQSFIPRINLTNQCIQLVLL